jgi:YggT family protein
VFVGAYFLTALANLLNLVIIVYIWLVIARAVLSWVSPDPFNPIVRFLYRVTEPVLRPVRHRLPTLALGLDLSPMVVILVLYFLKEFLVPVLHRLAMEIG